MSDEQDVTLGEVYRLCLSIDKSVKEQNGRVRTAESDIAILKDRGNRDNTARLAGVGSLLGGAIYALYHAIGSGK